MKDESKEKDMETKYPKEQYVGVHTLTFYVTDEDDNDLQNEDGTTKQFYFEGRLKALEHLTEDMSIDDLQEITILNKGSK